MVFLKLFNRIRQVGELSCAVQVGLEAVEEIFGEAAGSLIETGACVEGFGFQEGLPGGVQDAVGEIEAHTFEGGEPEGDVQGVVVTCRGLIAQAAFANGKYHALSLPSGEADAGGTEEFSAGGLQQIQIPGIIDVIADGAFGISDAMGVMENGALHGPSVAGGERPGKWNGCREDAHSHLILGAHY
jgi:hypothetical protein